MNTRLNAVGIYSINGPERATQATTYCDAYPEDDFGCTLLTGLEKYDESTNILPSEIPTRGFQRFVQSAFSGKYSKYSETWTTDGWCTEDEEFDLSTVSVPVSA